MSDPHRLLVEGADDFERDLLRSAQGEGPAKDRRAAVLAALGVPAAMTNAAGAGGGATMAGAGAKAGGAVLVKWAGVVGVTTAVAVGAVGAVRSSREDASPPSAGVEHTAHVATPAATPRTMARAIEAAEPAPSAEATSRQIAATPAPPSTGAIVAPVVASPAPRSRVQPSSAASATSTPPPPATANLHAEALPEAITASPVSPPAARSNLLADEVAALDLARAALHDQRPADALVALDAYSSRFPRGVLLQEATVVGIEALAALGRRDEATQLGRDFLAAHPDSPLAPRVRAGARIP